jgi:hypothetical protein
MVPDSPVARGFHQKSMESMREMVHGVQVQVLVVAAVVVAAVVTAALVVAAVHAHAHVCE